jgi:hypothetical protein
MTEPEQADTFFERITVPVNYEANSNGFDFVNPVEVAEMFAAATGIAAQLGGQCETLTSVIANVEFQLVQKERELFRLRRSLLADSFGGVKAGWSTAVLEAYVFTCAVALDRTTALTSLEGDIEELQDTLGMHKPRLDKLKSRARLLEKNMEMAKQYLDFDKLMQRVTNHGRGV